MRWSAFPPWPTPSSTASFTTPTGSTSPARACANDARRHDNRRDRRETLRATGGPTRPWTTAGYATALWRARLSPPLPTATQPVAPTPRGDGHPNRLDRTGPGQHHSLRSAEADVRWPASNRNPGRVEAEIAPRPPHRSGRASFSHPALPEVHPVASVDLPFQARVIDGVGSGKACIIRLNRSHVMPRWLRRASARCQRRRTS